MDPINISTSPAVFRWKPAAWLRVSGEDAATFLQGQFTNDLRALGVGAAVYGLWLSVKGKVLADSFVIRGSGAEEWWVGSYFSSATAIRERLEAFVIADDVVIEDVTEAWTGLSLIGVEDERVRLAAKEGLSFPGRRRRADCHEIVVPNESGDDARARFADLAEADVEMIEAMRIADGVPAVPRDIGPTDLPNEGGLEGDAISFTKGCYLGQEVMARLKSMGQVRRRLLRVRTDGVELPRVPAALFCGTKQVGELRSVAVDPAGSGGIGLAMLTLMHVDADVKLALALDAAPTVALWDKP